MNKNSNSICHDILSAKFGPEILVLTCLSGKISLKFQVSPQIQSSGFGFKILAFKSLAPIYWHQGFVFFAESPDPRKQEDQLANMIKIICLTPFLPSSK